MVSQPLLAKHRGQLVLTLTALFLTLILGALLVNARHLSLHALSHVSQGVRNCQLQADIYAEGLAEGPVNRVQLTHVEDCWLCWERWSVIGSQSYRLRVFVRPCPPEAVLQAARTPLFD